jgi:lipid II:glycine glycyltransferase (peptidoglycan interpeptide bridge formation enzyme)
MWHTFAPRDKARLFVAEHEGEALASLFIIGFAGTATYRFGGWSGLKKSVPPNELLHWTAMNWARERGYRHYDFGDIYPEMALAALSGNLEEMNGVTKFKLNFGGEVVLFPGAYDYGLLRRLTPLLERSRPLVNRVIGRVRGGSG